MTRLGALRGLIGRRVGGRYELVEELDGDDDRVPYEAVDVDGTPCLVTLLDSTGGGEPPVDGGPRLDAGTDDVLGCRYVVEPLSDEAQPRTGQADAGPASGLVGRLFASEYRIVRRLGGGGMGTVYEAETRDGERVALKVIGRGAPSPHDRRRFMREARAATKLRSPHVARVFSSGVDRESGSPFLVMELLQGEDLAGVLAREGALEPAVAVRIAIEACRGLAEAHEAGLVHRDIKPANLFLSEVGGSIVVKVCDFGIVKDVSLLHDETSLTRTGALVGSPGYMSPEQATDSSVVDHRTDIWGLGASLYEALAGVPPWVGSKNVGEILLHLHAHEVPPLAEAAPWLDHSLAQAVQRCLARNPVDRYPSANALSEALSPFGATGLPVGRIHGLSPTVRGELGTQSQPRPDASTTTAVGRDPEAKAKPPRRFLLGGAVVATALIGVALWRTAGEPVSPSKSSPPACDVTSCSAANGGKVSRCSPAGVCVALEAAGCSVLADEAARNDERTIWIGAMFPTDDPDPFMADLGRASRNAMELARRDFASVSSGLPTREQGSAARPLGIIACEDGVDAGRAARHLVDVGVAAVVGFRSSKEVIDLATQEFMPNDILVVPALNSSTLIATIPNAPSKSRLVYRTAVPTDDVMRALSEFVTSPLARQAAAADGDLKVALVRGHDPIGLAVSESAFALLRFNGRAAADDLEHFREVSYGDEADDGRFGRAVAAVLDHRPHILIFHLQTEEVAERLIEPIEASWQDQSRPLYVIPGTLDGPPFAALVRRRPDLLGRLFGLGPIATTPANLKFTNSYNATFGDSLAPADAPGAPYDSFYLVAYGAYASGVDTPRGSDIARGISKLVPPGDPAEIGPANILKVFGELDQGHSVDLQGTYSRMDFDPKTGDSPADYSILCARATTSKAGVESVDSGLVYDAESGTLRGTLDCSRER